MAILELRAYRRPTARAPTEVQALRGVDLAVGGRAAWWR